jgi:GDP-D-mannose 3', 5'-epimerase
MIPRAIEEKIVVAGAAGFIGHHLVNYLKEKGAWVRGVDIKPLEYATNADEFFMGDLRNKTFCLEALTLSSGEKIDEVYQLAADMGGAEYIFSGKHDLDVMHNSAQINLNFADLNQFFKRLFFSSSACIYPQEIQRDVGNKGLREEFAYPANPDSEYGWEKIFSERLYLAMMRNKGVPVRIARFHNIFGPEGTWTGGREKAPAAMCRKVAEVENRGTIEILGDGKQTRSFLYIDECLEGVYRLMHSDFTGPVNIGSEEMISINNLAYMAANIAGKKIKLRHVKSDSLGVRGRKSQNDLIKEKLEWNPNYPLRRGMEKTYHWIEEQVHNAYPEKK